jgi:hypothetical protein
MILLLCISVMLIAVGTNFKPTQTQILGLVRGPSPAQTPMPTPTPRPTPTSGSLFFVAPNGSPGGDGSISRPWDLATALRHPPMVKPGDTIWLRGGIYPGEFESRLAGTTTAPITVRQYAGERATIEGGLNVASSDAVYRDFEVRGYPNFNRVSTQATTFPGDIVRTGLNIRASRVKLINLIIHDMSDGVANNYAGTTDTEVYGCIIYNNGWMAPDRGHGHGIYPQNESGTKRIIDNIIFNQFGHGLHAYGSSAASLKGFHIEGNISFNNGILASSLARNILVGGGSLAERVTITNNYAYYPPSEGNGQSANIGYEPYGAGVTSPTITNNVFISGDIAFALNKASGATVAGNTIWGSTPGFNSSQYPSNTYHQSRPAGFQAFVRPNQYEPGRAHMVVYNWDLNSTVEVNVSGVLAIGASYEVRNAQDYFGAPVASGTYDGKPLRLPMTGLKVAAPAGYDITPGPTGPEFNVFVLIQR